MDPDTSSTQFVDAGDGSGRSICLLRMATSRSNAASLVSIDSLDISIASHVLWWDLPCSFIVP